MARKSSVSSRATSKNVITIHVGDVQTRKKAKKTRKSKKAVEDGQFLTLMKGMAQRPIAPSTSTTSIRLEAPNLGRFISVPEPLRPDVYGAVPSVVNPVGVSRPSNGSMPDPRPNPRSENPLAANPNDIEPRPANVLAVASQPAIGPNMIRPISSGGFVWNPNISPPSQDEMLQEFRQRSTSEAARLMAAASSSSSSSSDAYRRMQDKQAALDGFLQPGGPSVSQYRNLLVSSGAVVPSNIRTKEQLMNMVYQNIDRIFGSE